MKLAYTIQIGPQPRRHGRREHRDTALVTLAFPNEDFASREVDILDPQSQALHQPEPGTIEQHCHDPRNAVKGGQQRAHLGPCEDDR